MIVKVILLLVIVGFIVVKSLPRQSRQSVEDVKRRSEIEAEAEERDGVTDEEVKEVYIFCCPTCCFEYVCRSICIEVQFNKEKTFFRYWRIAYKSRE